MYEVLDWCHVIPLHSNILMIPVKELLEDRLPSHISSTGCEVIIAQHHAECIEDPAYMPQNPLKSGSRSTSMAEDTVYVFAYTGNQLHMLTATRSK